MIFAENISAAVCKDVHKLFVSGYTGAKHPQDIEEGGRKMSGKQAVLKVKRSKERSEVTCSYERTVSGGYPLV